jgi:hypothetical protein
MEDGASAEIAVVGNEGILGISLFMGGDTTPSRAIVQSAGHGFRVKADLLKSEFERFGATMHLLLRYTQALITQMSQTAVCNRHHSIDQQLCRWLLLSLDRLTGRRKLLAEIGRTMCSALDQGSALFCIATVRQPEVARGATDFARNRHRRDVQQGTVWSGPMILRAVEHAFHDLIARAR